MTGLKEMIIGIFVIAGVLAFCSYQEQSFYQLASQKNNVNVVAFQNQ